MAKFDGQNFVMFQKRVKAVLSQKGLNKYLRVLPTTEDEKEEDEKAEGLVVMMLSDAVLGGVQEYHSTMDLWEKLKKRHLANSRAVKSRLHYALTTIRYSGGDAVKFTSEFTQITNELAAIGKPVDAEWQESFFIAAITDRCKEFVTAYEAVEEKTPEAEIEYSGRAEALIDKFIAYVDKGTKPERPKEGEPNEVALAADSGRKPYFPYNCHRCGKKGHKKADCKSRKGANEQKQPSQSMGSWALMAGKGMNSPRLILDPASTYHICNEKNRFGKDYKPFKKAKLVGGIAAGTNVQCLGIGTTKWKVLNSSDEYIEIELRNTMYAPNASENLLSGGVLESNGAKITFENGMATIENEELVLVGLRESNNLYYFGERSHEESNTKCFAAQKSRDVKHARYCHPGEWVSKQIGLEHVDRETCQACSIAKSKQREFPEGSLTTEYEIAGKVCADLCGPIKPTSAGGAKYLQPCLEKRTHWLSISALKKKSQAEEELLRTIAYIERQTGKKVKVVQTDNGGEYISLQMKEHFRKKGIRHQTSIRYNPKQNASVEAVNRVLMTRVVAMMQHSGLPMKYWADAAACAAYVWNYTPSTAIDGKTPNELFYGRKQSADHLRVFGCRAIVHIPKAMRKKGKLSPRAFQGVMIGYSQTQKGYRILNPDTNEVTVSRDVDFDEDVFPFKEDVLNSSGGLSIERSDKSGEEYGIDLSEFPLMEELDSGSDQESGEADNPHESIPDNLSNQEEEILHEHIEIERENSTEEITAETESENSTEEVRTGRGNWFGPLTRSRAGSARVAKCLKARGLANDPTSFGEAMQSKEKERWLEAAKKERKKMLEKKVIGPLVKPPKEKNNYASKVGFGN